MFTGEKLEELLAYLREPGSTYKLAGEKFGCSKSTIEKTIYRLRRKIAEATKAAKSKTDSPQGRLDFGKGGSNG